MVSIKKLPIIMAVVTMFILAFSSQAFAASSVTVESHSSQTLGRTVNYNVYLPPSYSTNTTKYYPVMYLFHGMNGSNTDWTSYGMQSIVDRAGGKEMVIIMPNAFNTFYVDGYQSGMKYETYMFKEFIPYVESKYRINAADGKNRSVAGLSMGGFGAAYYGFKYPDMFSSAYAMSGGFYVTGNLSSVLNKNNYPAFTMENGTEDTLVGQMNTRLHNELQSAGIPHDYILRSGNHNPEFWTGCLPKAIVFASKYFVDDVPATSTPVKTNTPVVSISANPVPDLNGDKAINMADVILLATVFNTVAGDGRYKAEYDLNGDGNINMSDVMIIASKFNTIISSDTPTNTPSITPTPVVSSNTKILPAVNSVDTDGPFTVAIDQNAGPNRKGWVIRPTTLGSQGVTAHPIFIFGPGAGSQPSAYQDLIKRIASHGFVVYSEESSSNGTEMKAAIDWLIQQNNNSSSQYYKKLDATRIGAGGHSRGSLAAFGASTDSRITTTVHIDGGSFDGTGGTNLRKPAALICGLADNLALENTKTDYKNATAPVWLGLMQGVDHGTGPQKSLSATVAWLRWQLGGETERKSMFIGQGAVYNTGMWQAQSKNW